MQLQTIKEMWESYLEDVVPAKASAAQVHDTKLAFYGGITAITMTLTNEVAHMSNLEAEKEIKKYIAEIYAFAEEIRMRIGASRN